LRFSPQYGLNFRENALGKVLKSVNKKSTLRRHREYWVNVPDHGAAGQHNGRCCIAGEAVLPNG
jgi:hypothetical protein